MLDSDSSGNTIADLKWLRQISMQLVALHDVDSLWEQCLDSAVALMQADRGMVHVFDSAKGDLQLRTARGWPTGSPAVLHRVTPAMSTSCGQALANRARAFVDYQRDAAAADSAEGRAHRDAGIRCSLSMPLLARNGDVCGIVTTHWDQSLEPSERQLLLFDSVTRLAAGLLERHQSEANTAQLQYQTARLRDLAMQLTSAEHRERRRLARLLHDHLQQLLVAAKMRLKILGDGPPESFGGKLPAAIDLLDQAIDASRSLAVELSPPVLYQAGLSAALDWLARWIQEKHGLTVHGTYDEDVKPESDEILAVLFNATRELLLNVVKHARTPEAWVTLARVGNAQIRIVVEDHGRGFDTQNTRRSELRSLGLFELMERLEFIGGNVDVRSSPGSGTTIAITAPTGLALLAQPAPAKKRIATPGAARARDAGSSDNRSDTIRVLIADDHKVVREGLIAMLSNEPDIVVVAEAADGLEAVEQANRCCPDVAVLDVSMPRLNGIEATRRIRTEFPRTRIVGLSTHADPEIANAMRTAGATEYLTKDGPAERLLMAIRGEAYVAAS